MASRTERESSFCDVGQSHAIVKALHAQKYLSTFCDVIMKVCGREIFAHSNILAAASPYFNTFLSQDLPRQFSQRSPQVIEIQIDGSEPNMLYEEAVASVIDFIYTGKMTVKETNASQISEIARIMQMDNVVKFCDDFCSGKNADPNPASTTSSSTGTGYRDIGVSTTVVYPQTPRQASTVPHNIPSEVVHPKLRAGKLVSISTQVTPQVLGIQSPRPKETRDIRTQTCGRDFPQKLAKPGRRPSSTGKGRKPHSTPPDDEQSNFLITDEGKQIEEFLRDLGNDEAVAERKPRSNQKEIKTEAAKEESEECVGQQSQPSSLVGDSAKNLWTKSLDAPLALRRSPRKRKPTMKARCALKSRFMAVKREPKQQEEDSCPTDSGSLVKAQGQKRATEKEGEPERADSIAKEEDKEDYAFEAVNSELQESKPVWRPRKGVRSQYFARERFSRMRKFQCDACSFTTNKVREFASHRKLHKLEHNICYYCELKFDTREVLNDHLEKHKGPMPFFCPICDFRFKSKTQLNLHLPKHSDEKPFICEVCSVGFKWKHALKNHMIVHSNKKENLCDVCGYATAHKSQLKAHRLIHTGQTYRCPFPNCLFQATKRQNLKYHLLTHTREKPHQCEICGQSFSLVKNMRRHMLLHSAAKAHQCNKCKFNTTRYDKLKEHELKQHGLGSPPEKRVRISDLVAQNLMQASMSPDSSNLDESGVVPADQEELKQLVKLQYEGDGTVTFAPIQLQQDPDETVQQGENPEEGKEGSKPFALIPGQTIVVTQQPNQNGDMEATEILPVEVATPEGVAVAEGIPVTTSQDGTYQTIQFAEVMISTSQTDPYVQQVTFVAQ